MLLAVTLKKQFILNQISCGNFIHDNMLSKSISTVLVFFCHLRIYLSFLSNNICMDKLEIDFY